MSTATLTRPTPVSPSEAEAVLTAPDGCTKYRASQLSPSAAEIADWCHPTQTPPTLHDLAIQLGLRA